MLQVIQPQVFLGMNAVIASEAMRGLLRLVERVAKTNAAVLIKGESGSGKELIARALHHYSLRCSKPWVDVSCAALPEHLMESELFGHERGAFSGADSAKPGLFELAHMGTFFLDEVGELEARMQVKLLRVLDGTPYYRLGSTRKISVDVRVIVATNRNLEEQVHAGKFRSDLYHRLNQIEIQVPPLRERPEDIESLARFFLEQLCPCRGFAPDALRALRAYSWPGNVRELRNVVTKAAVMSEDGLIRASDLPRYLWAPSPTHAPVGAGAFAAAAPTCNLDEMERRMISDVLTRTGGRRKKAADLLGISRRTLTRKLRTHGMGGEQETRAASASAGSAQ